MTKEKSIKDTISFKMPSKGEIKQRYTEAYEVIHRITDMNRRFECKLLIDVDSTRTWHPCT